MVVFFLLPFQLFGLNQLSIRVTSVRENQGGSGNLKKTFSNQGTIRECYRGKNGVGGVGARILTKYRYGLLVILRLGQYQSWFREKNQGIRK